VTGSVIAVIAVAVMVAIAGYLIGSLLFSIRKEKQQSRLRRTWANFGLSIAFCALFLTSWAAQAVSEWDVYRKEQQDHNQPIEVVEFVNQFAQSTLENWQSEFLQLFSFVVLSALFIHHGSAESKDSDDRMERKIDEIHAEVVKKK
jgi:branched-subunit amino acid ABC-type transport system permease component